jgi:hypothetical protein
MKGVFEILLAQKTGLISDRPLTENQLLDFKIQVDKLFNEAKSSADKKIDAEQLAELEAERSETEPLIKNSIEAINYYNRIKLILSGKVPAQEKLPNLQRSKLKPRDLDKLLKREKNTEKAKSHPLGVFELLLERYKNGMVIADRFLTEVEFNAFTQQIILLSDEATKFNLSKSSIEELNPKTHKLIEYLERYLRVEKKVKDAEQDQMKRLERRRRRERHPNSEGAAQSSSMAMAIAMATAMEPKSQIKLEPILEDEPFKTLAGSIPTPQTLQPRPSHNILNASDAQVISTDRAIKKERRPRRIKNIDPQARKISPLLQYATAKMLKKLKGDAEVLSATSLSNQDSPKQEGKVLAGSLPTPTPPPPPQSPEKKGRGR